MKKLPAFDIWIDGDDGERIEVCVTYTVDEETREVTLAKITPSVRDELVEWIWEDQRQLSELLQAAYDDDDEKRTEEAMERARDDG